MKKIAAIIFLFVALYGANAQTPSKSPWPAITRQTHPWTRWWWMGSAVDQKNLDVLIAQYAKAGFGGVEITPIYGVNGYEDKFIDFLSPKWMEMLRFTVKKAGSVGMGVDMNTGTGWPFGGPQITPEFAASKLRTRIFELDGNQQLTEPIKLDSPALKNFEPKLQALTAYGDKGQVINLFKNVGPDGKIDQTLQASEKWPGVVTYGEQSTGQYGGLGNYLMPAVASDGKVTWKLQPGKWKLIAAFIDKTAQVVKRSAPGGAGYTMDHLSKPALNTYLKRFDNAFGATSPGVRSFFNDSYEVYFADASPAIFDEFRQRRGYDARNYIRELTGKDSTEQVARIRTDYRETMADMVLENFTQPWTNWINSKKALSRNQAHGSPGNILDLYATVDIPECETFGLTRFPIKGLNFYTNDTRNVPPDPIMLKFASSGAHVMGKPLTSSETFTWLGEHFKVPLSHAKAEVEQVFLTGVNHTFYHGTAYSPQEAGWPGWLFYASVEFSPNNSLWPHLKGLNDYITRCQSVLQAGKADNELLVYWPIFDVWHQAPAKLDMQISIHTVDTWLQPTQFYKTSSGLMNAGYSVDFVTDRMLGKSKVANGAVKVSDAGAVYKVLVIPQSRFIPVETFESALRLAEQGATIILQSLPADVPGFGNLESRRAKLKALANSLSFKDAGKGVKEAKAGKGSVLLAQNIQDALEYRKINRETISDSGLKFIRRDNNGDKSYFIVNHTADAIDKQIQLNATGSVTILDPLTGDYGLAASSVSANKTTVHVQLPSGGSLILKTSKVKPNLKTWRYIQQAGKPVAVNGNWSLRFTGGGPQIPAAQVLPKLVSWTDLADKNAANFSGTADYSTIFNLPAKTTERYMLDLGDVRESAHVWVNGMDAGVLWSVPYQADISKYLKAGQNTIKIEVANLMANRIRDLDKRKVEWRKYKEINFVDLFYKPFDASGWADQPSGLLGPVIIKPYKLK